MRITVSNIQASTIPVDGTPTTGGLYRAKAIAKSKLHEELAKHQPTDANGKANPLHKRLVEAMKPENIAAEYAHEGKVYACVAGRLHEFDEATGEVGAFVDVRRWAEPFAFEQIVATLVVTM